MKKNLLILLLLLSSAGSSYAMEDASPSKKGNKRQLTTDDSSKKKKRRTNESPPLLCTLISAMEDEEINTVKDILTYLSEDINKKEHNHQATPLQVAVETGNVDLITAVIGNKHIDINHPNHRDDEGNGPLHQTLLKYGDNSQGPLLQALLTSPDLDKNLQNKYGWTALMCASFGETLDCRPPINRPENSEDKEDGDRKNNQLNPTAVALLLKAGANPHQKSTCMWNNIPAGSTALNITFRYLPNKYEQDLDVDLTIVQLLSSYPDIETAKCDVEEELWQTANANPDGLLHPFLQQENLAKVKEKKDELLRATDSNYLTEFFWPEGAGIGDILRNMEE